MADKSRENCIICQIVGGKIPSKKVYEDGLIMAVLDVNGANRGLSCVMTKNHIAIIEQVPDSESGKMFQVSNKISTAIFEALGAQGTNIFVANGIPAGQTVARFMINVIPRKENDGISLQWQPKQLSEEEMSTVELKLKDSAKNVGNFEKEKKTPKVSAPKPVMLSDEEEEFFSRQLRRVP